MRTLRRIIATLLLAASLAAAADWGALQPEGFVNDFAKVLSPRAREGLERYCREIQRTTGAQIALVTVPSLDGEPIEDVANYLFRHWKVGDKKTNEGVLVLLAIEDRRSRVEVGYGLEPALTDGFVGSVLRSMRAPLRSGNYDMAMAEAAMALGQAIGKAKGVTTSGPAPVQGRREAPEPFPWTAALGALGVFALIFFAGRGRQGGGRGYGGGDVLTAILLGQMLGGRRMGPRGGGGFGGYDSSDSFGGFGGGDSGGGGASSDW